MVLYQSTFKFLKEIEKAGIENKTDCIVASTVPYLNQESARKIAKTEVSLQT